MTPKRCNHHKLTDEAWDICTQPFKINQFPSLEERDRKKNRTAPWYGAYVISVIMWATLCLWMCLGTFYVEKWNKKYAQLHDVCTS